MPLQPLKIKKNWTKNTNTREENWDELANNVSAFATRTLNNLKQLGLDIGGSAYDYNEVGVTTQTTPVTTRLTALEAANFTQAGIRNIAFDLSTAGVVKLTSADGTALSSSNIGYATFNATSDVGELISRSVTADLSLTLTGAHWGFDTQGDLTDQPLWVVLADTGSGVIMGISAHANRVTITAADGETSAGSVTTFDKVLVDTDPGATLSCITIAKLLADFDDTGNPGGENYWTIQTAVGEVDIGQHVRTFDAVTGYVDTLYF